MITFKFSSKINRAGTQFALLGIVLGLGLGLVLVFFLFGDQLLGPSESQTSQASSESSEKLPRIELINAENMLSKISSDPAKVKLLNVWATWCRPCIKEMPYIMQTYEQFKADGMSLYLVTADMESETEKARKFLRDFGVDFVTYQKGDDDLEFIDRMSPEWTGALPATFLYDETGSLVDFWMGEASLEEFQEAVSKVLN